MDTREVRKKMAAAHNLGQPVILSPEEVKALLYNSSTHLECSSCGFIVRSPGQVSREWDVAREGRAWFWKDTIHEHAATCTWAANWKDAP